MIYINSKERELDATVHTFCAPLYGTGRWMVGGHTEASTSATATFIRHQGRVYAVTCHHVIDAFRVESIKSGRLLAPSLHLGNTIVQFSESTDRGVEKWSFRSCRDFASPEILECEERMNDFQRKNSKLPDIAIADITSKWSSISQTGRPLAALDLDEWVAPIWDDVQHVWLAYGFPTDHKTRDKNMVAAPMPRIASEIVSFPGDGKLEFTLCSSLEKEHQWGFSGVSGGPVFAPHKTEDKFAFVGVVFEGAPSCMKVERNTDAIIQPEDIYIMANYISPDIFKTWIDGPSYGVTFNLNDARIST